MSVFEHSASQPPKPVPNSLDNLAKDELLASSNQLNHYKRLATNLFNLFHDESLAIAGLLHGIDANQRASLKTKIPRDSLEILKGWDRFVSLLITSKTWEEEFPEDRAQRICNEVEPRSVLLLVHERLDRFDPYGLLARWNLDFRRSPTAFDHLDTLSPTCVYTSRRFEEKNLGRFLELVAAPAARLLGLWWEHTILRDAALAYRKPELFRDLVSLTERLHGSLGQKRLEWLQDFLPVTRVNNPEVPKLSWEWCHVASMAELLADATPREREDHIGQCGFLTILCEDEPDCYQALGHIHATLDFKQEFFRDALGRPTRSGYRALHTAVLDPYCNSGRPTYLRIRLTTPLYFKERLAPADSSHLEGLETRKRDWGSQEIQVFYGGEPRFIAPETSVLEFAALVIPDELPNLSCVRIRGKEVGLGYRLSSGDSPIFELSSAGGLPADWESSVRPGVAPKIKAVLRQSFDRILERSAREWLREELGDIHIDEMTLDVLLEIALLRKVGRQELASQSMSWWIRQVGLTRQMTQEQLAPTRIGIRKHQATQIIREAAIALRRLRSLVPVLDTESIPVRQIIRCHSCRPNRRSSLSVTGSSGNFVIHRDGEACAQSGIPLKWQSITAGQVFYIEMKSRPGIMREVLGILAENNINILELDVRLLGPNWGAARIEVEPISSAITETIRSHISVIENVPRVFGPEENPPSFIRQGFPPRGDKGPWLLSKRPEPFICGPVVREPYHFYGREQEMHQLCDVINRVRGGMSHGEMIFVSGPLRAGKTSLVQRALSILARQPEDLYLCVYHKAMVGETWAQVENAIFRRLVIRLEEIQHPLFRHFSRMDREDLQEVLVELGKDSKSQRATVLAIDEAVRLLAGNEGDDSAISRLNSFCEVLSQTPNIVLIWVGPAAPIIKLSDTAKRILLQESVQIPIEPLSSSETREMLRAQKLDLVHRIEVGPRIAQRVHLLTKGDPFWIAHLGYRMWLSTSRGTRRRIRFDFRTIEQAVADLAMSPAPFRGRLFPAGLESRDEQLMMAITLSMAELEKEAGVQPDRASHSQLGFLLPDILGRLRLRRFPCAESKLRLQLYEMMARGGALLLKDGSWGFAAPIVKMFFLHLLEMNGWKEVEPREQDR